MHFFNRAILASLHVGGHRSPTHTALDLTCQGLHADVPLHGWIDTKAALLRSIAARSTHQEAPAISGYERPLKGNPEHGSSLEKARGRAGKTDNPPPNHNLPDRHH